MINSRLTAPYQQRGLAALAVTIVLVAIATAAALYANRSGLVFQRLSSNQYQGEAALAAAEAGLDAFMAQIAADITAISEGATHGVILEPGAPSPGPGASSCLPSGATFPYAFRSTYTNGTDNSIFANTKYYSDSVDLLNTPDNINLGLGYRVQAKIGTSGELTVWSEGCTGTAGGSAACSENDIARAVAKRSIKAKGGLTLPNTAITVGGYADTRTTLDTRPAAGDPNPQCALVYGESFTSAAPAAVSCSAGSTLAACSQHHTTSNMFESFFGGSSKEEVKAQAQRDGTYFTDCPSGLTASPTKTIWIEPATGSIGNCAIAGQGSVVINGNITGLINNGAGGMFQGFLYTNNVYQFGAISIQGILAIENNWDRDALGAILNDYTATPRANGKMDANDPTLADTHTGAGSITVAFKRNAGTGGVPSTVSSQPGSWRDF